MGPFESYDKLVRLGIPQPFYPNDGPSRFDPPGYFPPRTLLRLFGILLRLNRYVKSPVQRNNKTLQGVDSDVLLCAFNTSYGRLARPHGLRHFGL